MLSLDSIWGMRVVQWPYRPKEVVVTGDRGDNRGVVEEGEAREFRDEEILWGCVYT